MPRWNVIEVSRAWGFARSVHDGDRASKIMNKAQSLCAGAQFFGAISISFPVQSSNQKYFSSLFQKYVLHSPHPDSPRGAARDRHGRWSWDAVDVRMCSALLRADERIVTDERRRVVLIPRRWDQVLRRRFAGRRWLQSPAHRGDRAISRKPSRRECRLLRLDPW